MNCLEKMIMVAVLLSVGSTLMAAEYHVSQTGSDAAAGSQKQPLKTISAAADKAQPGDVITVHEGIYRERINPPRGGTSDEKRIVYRAAEGESVTIKGSEIVTGWTHVTADTWVVSLSEEMFGEFNPYRDLIRGDWFISKGRKHHTGAVYLNGHWLTEARSKADVMKPAGASSLWFTDDASSTDNTTIWAQFKGVNPNEELVEINVRQSVFYPDETGMNYITVRGFTLEHAATPWAPPTAEQVGLIGTHWSKGWIIEDNEISHSKCVGVTLGKYGDKWDNTSANSAEGYVKTVERGLASGWSEKNVGHHIVRNNHIHDCEQAGIVGSLGAIFSTITGNEIHDIHVHRLFTGHEMAGIKFHASIDTEISNNHIYRTHLGIWLDWMTQGTRVSRNLLHDNGSRADLYVEVNHGPFLVDNNIFLSSLALADWSEGGAYAHNLFAGKIGPRPELRRSTPYHKAHSTELAGIVNIQGGDSRFYNNVFAAGSNLSGYDKAALPMFMSGNVYTKGSRSSKHDRQLLSMPAFDVAPKMVQKADGWYLDVSLDPAWKEAHGRKVVTTELLGVAKVPDLPFVKPDGTPYRIDTDYFGEARNAANPFPGPFEVPTEGRVNLKVWPR